MIDIEFVLVYTPANQTIVIEPITYANHCGGISPYTGWIYYTSFSAIYMVINTRNCSFNSTPLYYTSILGTSMRTDFMGYNAIYTASTTLFVIYVRSYSGWSSAQLLNYSQTEKWNVTWIGICY